MVDLFLVALLGFFGSFGHCVGMCGPLTVAFSLSAEKKNHFGSALSFHGLLNLGRVISYSLVGGILGGFGSLVIAGGNLGGVGSHLRQLMSIITGLMLIWFALAQLQPQWLPRLPILHPLSSGKGHSELFAGMNQLASQSRWFSPLLLGAVWGLIPCGFLYAAQIKAAETGNVWLGAGTMFAFGLGTSPTLVALGFGASRLSSDRRSQLFRLGSWVTLIIGVLTLLRSDAMVDYTGHGALILLMLALIARPVSKVWAGLLPYRRGLGVGAFILSLAHVFHMLDHSLQWNLPAIAFMLPEYRRGLIAGIAAIVLITPAAVTSFNPIQISLGKRWRQIHLLSIPAFILAILHTIFTGSSYFGEIQENWVNQVRVVIAVVLTVLVFCLRWRRFWAILGLEKFYVSPVSPEKSSTS